MTTIIGSKKLQRSKAPGVNRFHLKQKKGTIDVWWLFDDGGNKDRLQNTYPSILLSIAPGILRFLVFRSHSVNTSHPVYQTILAGLQTESVSRRL